MGNKKGQEFIPIIGHELRTPLTSMRGYLSMILEGDMGDINDNQRKALNHCYDSSVRMIKLVNDVLALSKIESGKMEYYKKNIKIVDLVKSVYNDLYLEIEHKGLEFHIEVDKNLKDSEIYIDDNRLKQVFLNLLTNSLKFTDKGEVKIKVTKIENKVLFEIIDTGVGIPEDKLDILFEKFIQVESPLQRQNTTGLGIGLALVKSFIKDFGSEIKVKSTEGKGSTFSFELKLK